VSSAGLAHTMRAFVSGEAVSPETRSRRLRSRRDAGAPQRSIVAGRNATQSGCVLTLHPFTPHPNLPPTSYPLRQSDGSPSSALLYSASSSFITVMPSSLWATWGSLFADALDQVTGRSARRARAGAALSN